MNMQEDLKELKKLSNLLDPYDWFYDVESKPLHYIVYVHYMGKEQDNIIPDLFAGKQVLVHFAASKLVDRSQFIQYLENLSFTYLGFDDENGNASWNQYGKQSLHLKIAKITAICGNSDITQDILYECHDQHNAVTNYSDKYPEMREKMDELYHEYGFDDIFKAL